MVGRVVEIASDDRHLSVARGFLVVSQHGTEMARLPIDDVDALIGAAHGLSFSNNVLVALAERGCPVVICGSNYRPAAIVWPFQGHHRCGARLSAQVSAGAPLRKRLWQQVVRSKIRMQACVLAARGLGPAALARMVPKVRSGDSANIEGQAARLYWRQMFGDDFRRDVDGEGPNVFLNYGYTVLRAIVARHIAAAGLHPNVPLHHSNEGNAFRLADDLMEPFRPLVDIWVAKLTTGSGTRFDSQAKRALGLLPARSMLSDGRHCTVTSLISALCRSLAEVFEGERAMLDLPSPNKDDLEVIFRDREEAEGCGPERA